MTARPLPQARNPGVQGPFERLMALGMLLPAPLKYIARRKLKRRQCQRMQDTFSELLAQTGPGDLCIDLGANIGDITCRMAQTGADIISFEPDPGAFEALQRATANLPNVTLIHKAAGHEADTLLLRRSARWSADDPAGHTQGSSIVHRDDASPVENAVSVEVVDFIAFLEGLDRDVRMIKMDIEGAEWDILNRLVDHPVLTRIDCIFVETHEREDPARYVPMFDALQARAEAMRRPYINLYWV